MDSNGATASAAASPPSSPPPPPSIPCAACKILRRRCGPNCILAPYFSPEEPLKFAIAHRVFGSSNIIKSLQMNYVEKLRREWLQEVPERNREDAVKSMVYEARARVRDPVYGSAGAIWQLQKQVRELETKLVVAQAELAMAQAEMDSMNTHHSRLLSLLSLHSPPSSPFWDFNHHDNIFVSSNAPPELYSSPLWT